MSSLLGLIGKASQAKKNLFKAFTDPNGQGGGLFDRANDFKANIAERKGDLLSQPMRDMGFGDALGVRMPKIEMFDDGMATDSAKLLQSTLASGGIANTSAGMLDLAKMDISLPTNQSPFFEQADDGYRTPLQREQDALDEQYRLEEASQGRGMLEDPNNFTPTPEAGMLRMS